MKKSKPKLPKLVVQIPAYNEEQTIARVIREIPRKIEGIGKVEVLVIDDGSRDRTSEVAKEAGADCVIKSKFNQGLGKNFKKGIDKCLELKADIIVNIDGDGQFNPHDIPKLINPILREEADMVTCSRFLNLQLTKNMPWIKKWGNRRFTKLISKITGKRFTDTQCGFRAYSKEAALKLNINGKFTYTQEVFIDLVEKGMRIREIPLEVRYFESRKSHISGKLTSYGLKSLAIIMRATRDTQPLTFFGVPGAVLFGFGFLGAFASFLYWAFEHMTSPVKTLLSASIFLMIFGFSMILLGLLADMLLTLKRSQDEILYKLKKQEFEE